MLASAYSRAAVLVRPTTPCLAATYAEEVGRPASPAIEAVLTIDPRPCACICGNSCLMHSHTPLRLTAIMRSNASSDHSAVFLPTASTCQPAIPALLKAQSSRPYVSTTVWTIDRTSASRLTSPDSDIA